MTTSVVSVGCDNATSSQYANEDPGARQQRPDPGTVENGAPYGTRLTRLTHKEYDYTVRDLLDVDATPSHDFLEDATFAGFDNNADGLRVAGRLGRDYRRAAEQLAEQVATTPTLLERLTPCWETNRECAEQFVGALGLRAFRRPLSDVEVARYAALFELGATSAEADTALAGGVRWVIEAMLQSPHFLYRAEFSTLEDESGLVPLDNYEVATRLSYMLTASMPDAELLSVARERDLASPDVLREQAERLVRQDTLKRRVVDFFEQWLDSQAFGNVSKDGDLFPEFSSELVDDYSEEFRRFVSAMTLEDERGFASLLTAPVGFVNQRTAEFYGFSAADFGPEFERVEFDSSQRRGLLSQLGFLSSHAYTTDSSPIHRGVFILRRVLCADLPDPPGDIDLTLPEASGDIVTTRDQVEAHTASAACRPCHSLINPVGFAFENYDALGRYRDQDNGAPVDASGSLELAEQSLQFDHALDLLDQIAESPAAHSCYASQWLRYAYGRVEAKSDEQTLSLLTERLADDDYSLQKLLVDLTEARAFTHRAPTERD